MISDIEERLTIPEEVDVVKEGKTFLVNGPKGEVKRGLFHPRIDIKIDKKEIIFSSKKATKREKAQLYTFKAHFKNMLEGVKQAHVYRLKICSSHFPMNVSVSGNQFIVKNFLGEKSQRALNIQQGVDVKVVGDEVVVSSCDKELAGMTASSIELLTAVKEKDLRVFQEGIYLVSS